MNLRLFPAALLFLIAPVTGLPAEPGAAAAPATQVQKLRTVPHPERPGAEIVVVQLDLPPGAESAAHGHPGLVIGCVVSGEFEFQIQGEPLRRLRAGDTFYEPPGAVHLVSRNPSRTQPARVVVFMEHPAGSPLVNPPAKAVHGHTP